MIRSSLPISALFIFWTGIAMVSPGSARATTVDLEEIIQEKISERHPTDTPAWWQSLGPDAPKVMMSMFERTTGTYPRLRLLDALGWFQDPDVIAFLKKQAENNKQGVLRNVAIRSVGNAAGASEVEFIGKFLTHEDPQTRTAAGQTLRKIQDPRATALLNKFYEKENLPWVKDRVLETPQGKAVSNGPLLRLESKSPHALKAEFAGRWKGALIIPLPRETGLLQIAAQAKTQLEGTNGLKGELSFVLPASAPLLPTPTPVSARPGTPVTLQFFQVSGKDTQVSGTLKGDALKDWGAKANTIPFDGELQERGSVRLLKIESREILLNLILRSEP
jgi:hypothetical protein